MDIPGGRWHETAELVGLRVKWRCGDLNRRTWVGSPGDDAQTAHAGFTSR